MGPGICTEEVLSSHFLPKTFRRQFILLQFVYYTNGASTISRKYFHCLYEDYFILLA